jgi:pyrroloquinoline quinone (PQQ) biosynthesis protein C
MTGLREQIGQLLVGFFQEPPLAFKYLRESVSMSEEIFKEVFKLRVLHMTPWVRNFPRWMGQVYANCPVVEARRFMIDNIVDEDMVDKRAGDSHIGLHRRLANAIGLSDEDLVNYEKNPIPAVSLVINSMYNITRNKSWQEGLIAIGIAEMTTVSPQSIDKKFTKGEGWEDLSLKVSEKLGLSEHDTAFLWVHHQADVGHGGAHLKVLETFTPESEVEKVIDAARTGLSWWRTMMDGIGGEMEKVIKARAKA